MTRLAQAKVERGGWYYGKWLGREERQAAEKRWAGRSYEHRADEDAQCGGCRYFAALGMDYGICANSVSPLDGCITFEHGGCPAHSSLSGPPQEGEK
jgi:hypothetical protein